METRKPNRTINWRQVLVHFLAFWCFTQAFISFSYLHDLAMLEVMRKSIGMVDTDRFSEAGYSAQNIVVYILVLMLIRLAGMLIALAISLFISLRRKWFWANCLIALGASYALSELELECWRNLARMLAFIGLNGKSPVVEFIIPGTVFLLIGLWLFFSKRLWRFIEQPGPQIVESY